MNAALLVVWLVCLVQCWPEEESSSNQLCLCHSIPLEHSMTGNLGGFVLKKGRGDHLYLELINSKYLTGSHFNEPWIDEKKGPLYTPLSPHCTKNIFKLHAGADNSLILCNWMLTRVNM